MIYSLRGTLTEIMQDGCVIECAGVGYFVSCSTSTIGALPEIGKQAFLYTVFNIRENGIDLCGFASENERDLYKMMCSVNGVGSKIALAMLSTFDADRFALLVAGGDSKSLTACPGVGQKLAQRMVLELKDKLSGFGSETITKVTRTVKTSAVSEAVAALVSLGFSGAEAASAVAAQPSDLSTEALISAALKSLATR